MRVLRNQILRQNGAINRLRSRGEHSCEDVWPKVFIAAALNSLDFCSVVAQIGVVSEFSLLAQP